MTQHEQLDEWVKGNPIHNDERDECCPDFSCCRKGIAPPKVRERFARAFREDDEATTMQMLMMFLGGCLEDIDVDVHIAGDVPAPSH